MGRTTVAHGSPRFCLRNTKRYVSESWHVKAMEWNGTYFGMSTVFLSKGPVGGLNFKHLSSRVICSYSIKCIQMCLSHLQLTHCGIASVCWCHYFSGCSGFSETPRWDASPEALRPPQWSAPRCFFDRGSGAPERWEGWMAQWMAYGDIRIRQNKISISAQRCGPLKRVTNRSTDKSTGISCHFEESAAQIWCQISSETFTMECRMSERRNCWT